MKNKDMVTEVYWYIFSASSQVRNEISQQEADFLW